MGMLRDRMEADLKLKGFSPNTQRCYLNCAARFAAHYGRSPVLMGEREIRQFLLHLVKEGHASRPPSACSWRRSSSCTS